MINTGDCCLTSDIRTSNGYRYVRVSEVSATGAPSPSHDGWANGREWPLTAHGHNTLISLKTTKLNSQPHKSIDKSIPQNLVQLYFLICLNCERY